MFVDDCGVSRYTIANSLRLRSSASARLNRTFGSVGTRTTFTYRALVKRGSLGSLMRFFSDSTNNSYLRFTAGDILEWNFHNGTSSFTITTSQVFRDPSAWYDIMVAVDTTQATAANRAKIYVNGSQVTAFASSAYPNLNDVSQFNNNVAHYISSYSGTAEFFDGYLSDVYFIDGQALTPASFGQTDTNGVWVPKAYSGTYGTNGFYLKFNDGSSTTNLCLDRSGNGNNWTPTNVSLTAGATYDWMVDTPTNVYATLNPLNTSNALSNGNLTTGVGSGSAFDSFSTIGVSSGKWYWETTQNSVSAQAQNGIAALVYNAGRTIISGDLYASYGSDGNKYVNGAAGAAYGATYTTNDVIGVALDCDGSTVTFYKNNVSQGAISITSGAAYGLFFRQSNSGISANFGQRPFTYTPPSGFKALCTANLPAVTVTNGRKHFDVKTRAGTGASANVTGYAFQPDLVWIKSRGRAIDNTLYDRLRGTQARLESNTTDAEVTADAGLTAFNSDGYTLNTLDQVNGTTATNSFVDWAWKANGAGVTNTSGTITSTVSANTTAGFSIVTYTGTGANATVGHGLGVVPKMVIVKNRGGATGMIVQHASLTSGTQFLQLAQTTGSATDVTMWNSTFAGASVFSLGSNINVNTNGNGHVAYCFAEVPGFSKFGSYTGNGSADGPFVFCGFRPRYVLIKRTDVADNWYIKDAGRDPFNTMGNTLLADSSGAEFTGGNTPIDFTSNGFKIRTTSAGVNSGTLVYAAFAENPFGGSNIAPSPAR